MIALAAILLSAQARPPEVNVAGRATATMTVRFGQTARFNRVALRPVRILEDSRCPRNVLCVWAGRLRVEFTVPGRAPLILENDQPIHIAGGRLTLLGAIPPRNRAGETIAPRAYRFVLRFEKP